jgi:hypothetical protein
MIKPGIELRLRARGLAIDAGLNDAPLVRCDHGNGIDAIVRVGMWVMPEGNLLTCVVAPIERPSVAPRIEILVGVERAPSPPLVNVGWSVPLTHPFEVFRLAVPFECIEPTGARLWTDVPDPIELDDDAIHEIRLVCRDYHHALTRRDLDKIERIVQFRTDDFSRVFGGDPAERRTRVREEFASVTEVPGFSLMDVDFDETRVSSCAAGRVFHVSCRDGSELIRALRPDGREPTPMQVYVSRIDGIWRIVR